MVDLQRMRFYYHLLLAVVHVSIAFHQPPNCHIHRYHPTSSTTSRKEPFFYAATKDAHIVETNKKYLINTLGYTNDKVQEMNQTTNILTLDIGIIEERANWLTRRLKLNSYELKRIIRHQPHVLGKRSDTNLGPTIDYLQSRLNLNDNALRKLILSAPHLLPCSIEDNIEPKLDWLQERLQLNDVQLGKMITRQPYTLGCSITENLEPTINWIQKRLHVNDATISKMIRTNPQIMHLNIESNLAPTMNWLQQRLHLDDTALSNVIQRMPQILGLSIDDNIEPKLDWLSEHLELDNDALSSMIQKSSGMLSCKIETNLEPTLHFYINAIESENSKQEALKLIVNNPTLFNYSLENRLKPRLEEAKSTGMKIDAAILRRMGQYTDDDWYKVLILYMMREDDEDGE